jgi:hypothetical protein
VGRQDVEKDGELRQALGPNVDPASFPSLPAMPLLDPKHFAIPSGPAFSPTPRHPPPHYSSLVQRILFYVCAIQTVVLIFGTLTWVQSTGGGVGDANNMMEIGRGRENIWCRSEFGKGVCDVYGYGSELLCFGQLDGLELMTDSMRHVELKTSSSLVCTKVTSRLLSSIISCQPSSPSQPPLTLSSPLVSIRGVGTSTRLKHVFHRAQTQNSPLRIAAIGTSHASNSSAAKSLWQPSDSSPSRIGAFRTTSRWICHVWAWSQVKRSVGARLDPSFLFALPACIIMLF